MALPAMVGQENFFLEKCCNSLMLYFSTPTLQISMSAVAIMEAAVTHVQIPMAAIIVNVWKGLSCRIPQFVLVSSQNFLSVGT